MKHSRDIQTLFYTLYPSLCAQASKYISHQAVCEDIVQDCFIRFWEYSESKKGIENPAAYLRTSVRNSCISYLRKETYDSTIDSPQVQAFLEDDSMSQKDIPLDPEAIIAEAMNLLPEKCRRIFEMSKLQGKSYQQIAKSLQISVKTVENQMGKALKIMRQFAQEHPHYFPILLFLYLI